MIRKIFARTALHPLLDALQFVFTGQLYFARSDVQRILSDATPVCFFLIISSIFSLLKIFRKMFYCRIHRDTHRLPQSAK